MSVAFFDGTPASPFEWVAVEKHDCEAKPECFYNFDVIAAPRDSLHESYVYFQDGLSAELHAQGVAEGTEELLLQ